MQMEGGKEAELTANPKADALCLMNDTAVERERERTVSPVWLAFYGTAKWHMWDQ